MPRGSGTRGAGKLRRTLRRLPKEIRADMGEVLEKSGRLLADDIAQAAPKDQGDLAKQVRYKLGNDKLSLHVGYSPKRAGFKRQWKKGGFVAIWQEFGARQHQAQPFIRPSFRARVPWIKQQMRMSLNRMLARARTWGR